MGTVSINLLNLIYPIIEVATNSAIAIKKIKKNSLYIRVRERSTLGLSLYSMDIEYSRRRHRHFVFAVNAAYGERERLYFLSAPTKLLYYVRNAIIILFSRRNVVLCRRRQRKRRHRYNRYSETKWPIDTTDRAPEAGSQLAASLKTLSSDMRLTEMRLGQEDTNVVPRIYHGVGCIRLLAVWLAFWLQAVRRFNIWR